MKFGGRVIACIALTASVLNGCARKESSPDPVAYKKQIEDWQARRLARLTREDGWLTLAGLFWLREGKNSVGGDSTNAVILPSDKTPAKVGTIIRKGNALLFTATKGVTVTWKDSSITSIDLATDETDNPTILRCGSVMFYVIKRGDLLGVRIKDSQSETRLRFKGLDFFPIDPEYRFEAVFERYPTPTILHIPTQAGVTEEDSCPGALVFSHHGVTCRLDAVIEQGSEDQLFIMFSDETSGKETYGPGRQVYAPLPDSAGHVILDFNQAYNWPCVFTVYATCPIPPRQNHLPFRVEAGEKMYVGHN